MDTPRPRVKLNTITLPKEMCSLGVISIQDMVKKLGGKFILWAISTSEHPLQILLCASSRQISFKKWGVVDFSWIFDNCHIVPIEVSLVWKNLCIAWNKFKQVIEHHPFAFEEEYTNVTMSSPGPITYTLKKVACKPILQGKLRDAGIIHVVDMLERPRSF